MRHTVRPGHPKFIGPLLLEDLPMYRDVFGQKVTYSEDDEDCIVHNGKLYKYSITMSPYFTDDRCCRVNIDGIYYYFG